jgi:peptide-methionine (S)-S-oxide reductase
MNPIERFKSVALAALIVVGIAAQAQPAFAQSTQTLTVAGGCFWCVESDFERVPGVIEALSGYTGGTTSNPTYKEVTRGGTGHYEAVQIEFDPSKVSRDQLLHMFFRSIDPTDNGGQFCDRGESYRSAVFVSNNAESQSAAAAKAAAQNALGKSVVTPILQAAKFYEAEAYHQDYYKGSKRVLTRFGAIKQSDAYKRYRKGCGRDARVKALWGDAAPFVSN